jgi:hypothetical protein
MDLKELIAKMDQIEQQPVQLNEEAQQLDEIAPLVLVGAGMGLKWLWDKFTQSQEEADRLKKEAEDAKRRGDEAEAARIAAEAEAARLKAEEDKRRAEEAYNSKCKEKVAKAHTLLSQLEDLVKAKAAPAQQAVKESFSIAGSLVESFGYTLEKKDQIDEWSKQDTGDTIRGALNGLSLGTGDNIRAGFKSAFGKDTYAQALEKEREETEKAQARSPSINFSTPALKIGDKELIGKKDWNPSAYDAANLAGAVALPIPGVGLAGQAVARGAKAALGTTKAARLATGTARLGTELGTTYGALKGSEHIIDNHTITTLVTSKGGDVRLGKAQSAMGFNDKELDGKMTPLTTAALEIVQQDNKLPVTGKLDDATAKVLGV